MRRQLWSRTGDVTASPARGGKGRDGVEEEEGEGTVWRRVKGGEGRGHHCVRLGKPWDSARQYSGGGALLRGFVGVGSGFCRIRREAALGITFCWIRGESSVGIR